MSKKWDYDVPTVELWKAVYRVLKPGGHMLVCCGTRTQHRMVVNIEDAGFTIFDIIVWHHGSGFPKSQDIEKSLKKITTEQEAQKYSGFGTALKPATELWTLCRKPLSESTVAKNVLKHGTGGLNIDETRIGYQGEVDKKQSGRPGHEGRRSTANIINTTPKMHSEQNHLGRWPANVILQHHEDCVQIGTKKVKSSNYKGEKGSGGMWSGITNKPIGPTYGDENGDETVEDWNCHSDCPVRIMDEQSGISKSSGGKNNFGGYAKYRELGTGKDDGSFSGGANIQNIGGLGDTGGASRFFYVAKAGNQERFFWCNDCEMVSNKKQNHKEHDLVFHPTQKPEMLLEYLIKMVSPPDGIVLDPFLGSGTLGVAANKLGIKWKGIDKDETYCKIARERKSETLGLSATETLLGYE